MLKIEDRQGGHQPQMRGALVLKIEDRQGRQFFNLRVKCGGPPASSRGSPHYMQLKVEDRGRASVAYEGGRGSRANSRGGGLLV